MDDCRGKCVGKKYQWKPGGLCLEKDPSSDAPECMWDGATRDEHFSYINDNSTPAKSCGRIIYRFGNFGGISKLANVCNETSSQAKRRRTLQFNNEVIDTTSQSDGSTFLKPKEKFDVVNALGEASEWEATLQDESSSPGLECLDESEDWLAACLNDPEINDSSTDMDSSDMNDAMIDVNEFSNPTTPMEADAVQQSVRLSPNIIFKGQMSYMRALATPASSVACPFDFIKPSGANGDVTLKDINQRIRIPPPPQPPKSAEPVVLETSAFSGKPVVNKTLILTEGGKGSITIMRTKG